MAKILIIGAGGVGSVVAHKCAQAAEVFDEIVLASRTKPRCDAIAASVLGGVSFTGGIGTVGGTLIGALVIGVLNNGLNLLKVSSYVQMIIKGIVIIAAVGVDILKTRASGVKK